MVGPVVLLLVPRGEKRLGSMPDSFCPASRCARAADEFTLYPPKTEPPPPRTPVPPGTPSASCRVRALHAELAGAERALAGARTRRQQQLVPRTETQLLGQRVRDMRVEAARLARSTQRLDKSAEELERELRRILARYKIPPEAQGELWRAINDGAGTRLARDAEHPRGSLDPPPTTTRQ
ncbi:uncharacterized protein LOC144740429 [Lampetra planeri]